MKSPLEEATLTRITGVPGFLFCRCRAYLPDGKAGGLASRSVYPDHHGYLRSPEGLGQGELDLDLAIGRLRNLPHRMTTPDTVTCTRPGLAITAGSIPVRNRLTTSPTPTEFPSSDWPAWLVIPTIRRRLSVDLARSPQRRSPRRYSVAAWPDRSVNPGGTIEGYLGGATTWNCTGLSFRVNCTPAGDSARFWPLTGRHTAGVDGWLGGIGVGPRAG